MNTKADESAGAALHAVPRTIQALKTTHARRFTYPMSLGRRTTGVRHICAACLCLLSEFAWGQIAFEDVTTTAGPFHAGSSWGASWGDLNGDGRPDLYASNHQQRGSVYRNNGDGSFTDVILTVDRARVWLNEPLQDAHGATWGDFDGDGDQDLLAARSSEGGRLQLLVNSGGIFVEEKATALGLTGFSTGRMGVWMDYNNDGLLDIAAMGAGYADVYRQQSSLFAKTTSAVGMYRQCYHDNYAQLLDITDDGRPELICGTVETYPEKLFDTSGSTYLDLTGLVYQDVLVPDAALADFDNDLSVDMLRLRGRIRPSEVKLVRPDRLEAYVTVSSTSEEKGFRFGASDPVTVAFAELERENEVTGAIYIGSSAQTPSALPFALDSADSATWGLPATRPNAGIYMGLDTQSDEWVVEVSSGGESSRDAYVAMEGSGLTNPTPINFTSAEYPLVPSLVAETGNGYERVYGFGIDSLWCKSVVAGDFDNDMDVDLYFACGGSVQNLPNRLFENLGDGTFVEVPDAAGAAGIQGVGLESGAGAADSVVMADYDSNGFLDLFVTNGVLLTPLRTGGPDQLFRNKGNGNHWIEIDLRGTATNPDGIGAKVYAQAGGITQLREQNGGYHRWSQDHSRIHFGLAGETTVDLTVAWPSGQVDQLPAVPADRAYRLTEGGQIEAIVFGPVPGLPAPQAGDECGEPVFDRQLDQAMYLWKDCATNQWRFRVAAGGSASNLFYTGSFASSDPLASVSGYSIEPGDLIDTTDPSNIAYTLAVGGTGTDGIDFAEAGADTCPRLDWEAESGTVSGAFAVRSDTNASGGRYVSATSGSRTTTPNPGDGVAFAVNVTGAGTYAIEAVVQATSSSSNSFWVQVDNGPYWLYNTVRTSSGQYVADYVNSESADPATVTLAPGQHTIRFLLRESGTRLDKAALVATHCDTPPTATRTCLYAESPIGAELYVGRNRLPGPLPFNLSTLTSEDCSNLRLSIDDVTVQEDGGSAQFTVSLSQQSADTVTVDYATADGTATGGIDYEATAAPATLVFPPFVTSQTISIPVYEDSAQEGSEYFYVSLTNPSFAMVDRRTGIATVQDSGPSACGQPTYDKATDAALFLWEDCGTGLWHLRVTGGGNPVNSGYRGWVNATQPFGEVSGFSLETSDLLADSGTGRIDYTLYVANTGQDGFDFGLPQGAEGCLGLDAPVGAAVLLGAQRTPVTLPLDLATLGACEPPPALSIGDVTVDEGAGFAHFAANLMPASSETVTVDYTTTDSAAIAGQDYEGTSGSLSFAPGQTALAVSVPILDDAESEAPETFLVVLSNPLHAALADASGTATIQDNELSPCGAPTYNKATDAGVFLWQDCDTGLWHARMSAGGSPVNLYYRGAVESNQVFTQVTGFSLEASDLLSTAGGSRIDYGLYVANSGQDGFDILPAPGAAVCFGLDGPAGAAVLLGPARAPVAVPLDLRTLGPCPPATP